MIIEFWGFPGSGKTTLCNELVRILRGGNEKVVRGTFDHLNKFCRITGKLFYSFLCLICERKFFLYNLKFFLKKRSARDFLNVTYLFARYSYYSKSDEIIIFDQGLIQAYLSIYCFVNNGKDYNFELLQKQLQQVFYLEVDIEENKKRLLKRAANGSRIQKEKRALSALYDTFRQLRIYMENNNNESFEYIDATQPISKNIKEIQDIMSLRKNMNKVK